MAISMRDMEIVAVRPSTPYSAGFVTIKVPGIKQELDLILFPQNQWLYVQKHGKVTKVSRPPKPKGKR